MINNLGAANRWLIGGLLVLVFSFSGAVKAEAATNLSGRILLQVQDKGQAWYVNPLDSRRYYLGRPADAFQLMRSLGLGVSNSDIAKFSNGAPSRLSGRILLKVQDKGQAYYVNPLSLKLHYLGRPADAFELMRQLGLGITNADLAKIITAGSSNLTSQNDQLKTLVYDFKYQNNSYQLSQDLYHNWYEFYRSAPKVYTYSSASPPSNIRDAFYGVFLTIKNGDESIKSLASKLKSMADQKNWTQDELAEFSLALIQYIPYDHEKLASSNNRNTNPYYPYETLYLDRGVCSDKTFLAVVLLRELGFGAAILDFPDSNHSAAGIACPLADSLDGTGYCYVETTNYFPLGVVPSSINSGQAQAKSNFEASFDISALGKMEIYQVISGRQYKGLSLTKQRVKNIYNLQSQLSLDQAELSSLEQEYRDKESALVVMKGRLDEYYAGGQISAYNQLVPEYNALVQSYNQGLSQYQEKVSAYNLRAADFNQAVKDFYQK